MTHITLPHNWRARPYQADLWRYMMNGGKRAVAVWHRRAGKDTMSLHWEAVATQQRVGVYWHMLPTLVQARRVIWEGINKHGDRMLDAFPGWNEPGKLNGIVRHIRHDQMKLEMHNGSQWYCLGSDNFDALVGSNPVGVVFSEWSLTNPKAWEYVRPILAENGGWAMFIYTPRGRNHGHTLYEMANGNDQWFCQRLTVDDTQAIGKEAIEEDRKAGMAPELIEQEYWCSFDAPLHGAYWGDQMSQADKDGHITKVPHDPAITVDTWWDLGHSDATAIWFVQQVAGEVHVIDYYEANGEALEHYAHVLTTKREQRKFVYGRHIWPHDGGAKTLASGGRPLSAMFGDLGFSVEVQPRSDVEVGIQRVRQVLPRAWFDRERCHLGLEALKSYRKEVDEDRSTDQRIFYKPKPLHDWSSHGADAFRTGCMATFDYNSPVVAKRDRYGGRGRAPSSAWVA